MSRWIKVATLDELSDGKMVPVEVEGEPVVLYRRAQEIYAFRDVCTHMEYPLHDGVIEEYVITCAYHGARFDIRTGQVLALPAFESLETYPVRVEGQEVWIDLEPE